MTNNYPFFSSKFKIALVCDLYLPKMDGTEIYLRCLADRLSEEGHDVHLITSYPGHENGEKFKIHRLKVPLLPKYKLPFTPSAFRELEDIFIQESFDIIHCHAQHVSPLAYGGLYLGKKLGISSIITWDYSPVGLHRMGLAFLNKIFNWSSWPVSFSGVSETVVRDIKVLVKNKRVSLLNIALDVLEWKVLPVAKDSNDLKIVSVMRFDKIKRSKVLINIIPHVLKRIPGKIRIKLNIIGLGHNWNSLEKQINRLGLESIVELQHNKTQDEIRNVYAQSDVFFQPSDWESFDQAALEARCAGLPVVAKDNGGINGFIRYGLEGFLGESDKELEDHLVRLILDSELRETIARHNRELTPHYDWKKSMIEHEMLYRETIELRKTFDKKENARSGLPEKSQNNEHVENLKGF